MVNRVIRNRRTSSAFLAAALLAAVPTFGTAGGTCPGKKDGESTSTARAGAGLQIVLDENGNRVANPEKAAPAAGINLNKSTEGLVAEKMPNGAIKVDLKGRFRSASVATIGANGKVKTRCTTNVEGKNQ